jgi:BRCT domain type II-containing protein
MSNCVELEKTNCKLPECIYVDKKRKYCRKSTRKSSTTPAKKSTSAKKMTNKTLESVKSSIKKSQKTNKKLSYVDKVILALQNGDEKTIEEMMMYHSDYYGSNIKGKQIYYIEGIKKCIKNGIVIQILTPNINTKFIGHKFKLI